MKKDKDLILKDYVFIIQSSEPYILTNEGRWGEELSGFSIQQPLAGLILKKDWENIKIFQNIDLGQNSVLLELNLVPHLRKHSDIEIMECPGYYEWTRLQSENNNFYNSVHEFNILISVDKDGVQNWRRTCSLLGQQSYKEV